MFFTIQYAFTKDLYLVGEEKLISCEQMEDVLISLINNNPEKNIVFYVHGRGKYPERVRSYVPHFEESYNIKVIGFIWKAWNHWYKRPYHSAIKTAPRLLKCLNEFQKFKLKNIELFAGKHVTFLVHSMGNVIMKEILQNYDMSNLRNDLFDQVILNAADVPRKNHKDWLKNLHLSPKIFITINNDDPVLASSALSDFSNEGGRRLGAKVKDPFVPARDAITQVSYLDIDNLSYIGHRHFADVIGKDKVRKIEKLFNYLFNNELGDFPIKYKRSKKFNNYLIFTRKEIEN
jgi:hypothetical protein